MGALIEAIDHNDNIIIIIEYYYNNYYINFIQAKLQHDVCTAACLWKQYVALVDRLEKKANNITFMYNKGLNPSIPWHWVV